MLGFFKCGFKQLKMKMSIKHIFENRKQNFMKLTLKMITWLTSYGPALLRYVG
jgi:hypothetical protein